MEDGEDLESSSPPGWYPYGEGRQAWWDGEAFGHITPLAAWRPQPDFQRHKPRIGKKATVALVLLGIALAVGLVISEFRVGIKNAPDAVATVPQSEVVDSTDGCARMYDFLKQAQQSDPMSEAEVEARLRGLRDAARANDPQLSLDVRDMLEAADETKVTEIVYVIMNRCLSVGDLTSDELAEVGVDPPAAT
jgi:hypothetical protein